MDVRHAAEDSEDFIREQQYHRGLAYERLTSVGSDEEDMMEDSIEVRQQRRRMAGRSGGQFGIRNGLRGLEYHYTWANHEERLVHELQAAFQTPPRSAKLEDEESMDIKVAQLASMVEDTDEDEEKKTAAVLSRRKLSYAEFDPPRFYAEHKFRKSIPSAYARADPAEGEGESIVDENKASKANTAIKRVSRKMSGFLQNVVRLSKDKSEVVDKGDTKSRPECPAQTRDSPIKEQLHQEADRASKHEDANEEFFTPTRGVRKVQGNMDEEIPDVVCFDPEYEA